MNSKEEADQQQSNVDRRDLRDSHQRLRAEKTIEQGMGFGAISEVFVDRDFRQIGTENVGAGLENDGDQSDHHLPPVGTQIGQQPLHQPAVVGFA